MTLPLTDAEFQRQFAKATKRGAARRRNQPLATSVRYDAVRGVTIELNNECLVSIPMHLLPELKGAAPKHLRQVEILGVGQAIAWPTLDQQFDLQQLLSDAVWGEALHPKGGEKSGRANRPRADSRRV